MYPYAEGQMSLKHLSPSVSTPYVAVSASSTLPQGHGGALPCVPQPEHKAFVPLDCLRALSKELCEQIYDEVP